MGSLYRLYLPSEMSRQSRLRLQRAPALHSRWHSVHRSPRCPPFRTLQRAPANPSQKLRKTYAYATPLGSWGCHCHDDNPFDCENDSTPSSTSAPSLTLRASVGVSPNLTSLREVLHISRTSRC